MSEAARVMGVSRRTIQRRIQAGQLATVDAGGVRYVVLDDTEVSAPPPAARVATGEEVAALRAELAAVTSERDYLRQQLTGALGVLHAHGVTRMIDAPSQPERTAQKPLQRAWWRFWER